VRTSSRAHYARLVVSPRDGLVVVVPRRFDHRRIPELVEQRAAWAEEALRRVAAERATVPGPDAPGTSPSTIELRALGERWRVCYRAESSKPTARPVDAETVLVTSGPGDAAIEALGCWLTGRARSAIVPWIADLATGHGAGPAAVSIRAQRSRWASCSASGRISVNRSVLFLPRGLAEHVLWHELCHLEEMNHSPRFWRALDRVDPDAAEHRGQLRTGWKYVPDWAQR
jgi:predicted metal-dependent hydrolase